MHCPQCGLQQISVEGSFCRGCGLPLRDVKELLVPDQLGAGSERGLSPQAKSAFNQGLLLLIVSLVLAIIMTLLHDLGLMPRIYVKVVAAVFLLAGLARMFSPYLARGDARRKQEKKGIPARGSAAQLETGASSYVSDAAHGVPISSFNPRRMDTAEMVQPKSVTEDTTKPLSKYAD